MTIYYQFSGPSDELGGFDPVTLTYLQKDCRSLKNVVVIASDLSAHAITDYYYERNLGWFEKFCDPEYQIHLIDDRVSKKEAHKLLASAQCIHLMGGYTEKQQELFEAFKIDRQTLEGADVVFGTSAGAMNLGPQLFRTDHRILSLKGLNACPAIIWPHFENQDVSVLQAESNRYGVCIIALMDDSGIRWKNQKATYLNPQGIFEFTPKK